MGFLALPCVRDAWSSLGEMSRESAMAAYVNEMKNVAQEVFKDCFTHILKFFISF